MSVVISRHIVNEKSMLKMPNTSVKRNQTPSDNNTVVSANHA